VRCSGFDDVCGNTVMVHRDDEGGNAGRLVAGGLKGAPRFRHPVLLPAARGVVASVGWCLLPAAGGDAARGRQCCYRRRAAMLSAQGGDGPVSKRRHQWRGGVAASGEVVLLLAPSGDATAGEQRCCRRLPPPKAMWGEDAISQSATYLIGEDDGGLEVI
jgi:hypothetical protein